MYQNGLLDRNVNRLFDTKGINRISGKPLKTRASGTLGVTGNPCLILGLCQGSTRAAVTSGHSGHKFDPSVAVLTPMAVNVTTVVTVLTPPLVQSDPSKFHGLKVNPVVTFESRFAESLVYCLGTHHGQGR